MKEQSSKEQSSKEKSTKEESTKEESTKEQLSLIPDPNQLLKLAQYKMPFGKYAGRLLIDLPEHYMVWFSRKGFPNGELGVMMRLVYEIKLNGLEKLIQPLKR